MGTGYVRQSGASIIDGNTIDDSHFNNEFNAVESAFNATTGHSHDGTLGEGPLISLTGSVTGVLPLANGGTGVALTDPNADRVVFWDDSAGAIAWLTVGTGLSISGTTLSASGIFLTDGDKGDITVSASGATWELDAGVITNTEVAAGANIDVSKLGTGVVDNTEFNYLNGVTSAIQTQLNAKSPIASPTFTGTVTVPASNFTVGASLPFSDSAGTLTLQNIDAIDATTEATLEAALELDSLQGNLSVSHLNGGTGASGSTYWRGDGTWATISTGTLNATGTPANNQIAVWTAADTLEGDVDFTFDTTNNIMNIGNGTGKLQFGSVDILVDSGGTMTLSNVDAVDATTKSTIQTAIDTLTSLTTIAPASNDGAALGSGSASFSDLFLASGGVINWANGGVVLTHSSGSDLIQVSGGKFAVAGSASGPGSVQLYEDTDNGTNYVEVQAPSSVASNAVVTLPSTDGGTILANNQTATISKGFTLTPYSGGTVSSGTFTPDAANGNYQYYTNNGAHTFAVPASDCAIDILVTNGASAGSITFSGYTVGTTGDTLTTTNTHKFVISVRRINSISTYLIKALQ